MASQCTANSSPTERLDPRIQKQLYEIIDNADPQVSDKFFRSPCRPHKQSKSSLGLLKFVMDISRPGEWKERFENALFDDDSILEPEGRQKADQVINSFVEQETKARTAFLIHKHRFPSQIWHCCSRLCFASIAIDAEQVHLLEELILIHDHAEKCHCALENLPRLIEKRRKGRGGSAIGYVAPSREERERSSMGSFATNRQEHLKSFEKFFLEVLPFLYAEQDSPRGAPRPPFKICTEAITCLLGVSRQFIYNRKLFPNENGDKEDPSSIVDSSGVRLRQHRRNGLRVKVSPVQSIPSHECGCDVPCFADVPTWVLVSEYDEFEKLSRELYPRHKENSFLLNRMYSPLSNSTIDVCNRALAALYNVSPSLISDVRLALNAMCSDSASFDRSLLTNGEKRYKYQGGHPANSLPSRIREQVENHLDYILLADPAGSNGESVCRVYSPEINTQEKLRNVLREAMSSDSSSSIASGPNDESDYEISASTLQRMINSYFRPRNYHRISFTQSDHIACPTCKTLKYAILEYCHESRRAERELKGLSLSPRPFVQADVIQMEVLSRTAETKKFQEDESLAELNRHTSRDKRIRECVKIISDFFRSVENQYRQRPVAVSESNGWRWNSYLDRASVTHQDDMTKVDLPHFIVSASSDITIWRFDVNAHVNAVTNDAVVFSHEQGTGAKNASMIIEEILLEHLLQCKGESIRLVISDNASVGKNWLTTIAFPQYMLDQGLAEICIIIFLENNHGKYLADMLFGQFQTKRKRQTLLGVDGLLAGFEGLGRRSGKLHGFTLNTLSSVDFSAVLSSLGYQTSPPKEFGFVKRNIPFAAACVAGTKKRLSFDLKRLIGPMLPDEAGMVRISTEPPGHKTQQERPFEDRFFDVPAACLPKWTNRESSRNVASTKKTGPATRKKGVGSDPSDPPVVVALDKPFAESGNGVVSCRTANKVGYNGIGFIDQNACPELRQTNSHLVQRAWPPGFMRLCGPSKSSSEPIPEGESVKCAPENWIMRMPVSHFCKNGGYNARYPPRNMLNARFRKGPRESQPWVPTATYQEPPFPICEKTSACDAMKQLARNHKNIGESVHVLHALREVFREMGDRDGAIDPWMHRRATVPTRQAIERYLNSLELFVAREMGHPKAPKILKQVFREDSETTKQVTTIEQKEREKQPPLSSSELKKIREKTFTKLFNEAQNRPGAMDRFICLVQKDHERFALELKQFNERKKAFDRDHELLPRETVR